MANEEITSVETSMNERPKKRTVLGPSLSESLPAKGERVATATAPGARTRPAAAGERPLVPSSSSGVRNRLPVFTEFWPSPATPSCSEISWLLLEIVRSSYTENDG